MESPKSSPRLLHVTSSLEYCCWSTRRVLSAMLRTPGAAAARNSFPSTGTSTQRRALSACACYCNCGCQPRVTALFLGQLAHRLGLRLLGTHNSGGCASDAPCRLFEMRYKFVLECPAKLLQQCQGHRPLRPAQCTMQLFMWQPEVWACTQRRRWKLCILLAQLHFMILVVERKPPFQ